MAKKTAQRPSKKQIVKVDDLRIDIHSTFNNTIISGAALNTGNVLAWASSGSSGFKGTKKGTPYAATTAMKTFLEKIAPYQPTTAKVFVSGAGNGRDAALRALVGSGLKVLGIRDVTPLPHNGCRAKKARRV
jgi:small subunit ribosomal protein S11